MRKKEKNCEISRSKNKLWKIKIKLGAVESEVEKARPVCTCTVCVTEPRTGHPWSTLWHHSGSWISNRHPLNAIQEENSLSAFIYIYIKTTFKLNSYKTDLKSSFLSLVWELWVQWHHKHHEVIVLIPCLFVQLSQFMSFLSLHTLSKASQSCMLLHDRQTQMSDGLLCRSEPQAYTLHPVFRVMSLWRKTISL